MEKRLYFHTEQIISDVLHGLNNRLKGYPGNPAAMLQTDSVISGIRFTLLYLREAMLYGNDAIFLENVRWFVMTSKFHHVPQFFYLESMLSLQSVLRNHIDETFYQEASHLIDQAVSLGFTPENQNESYLEQFGVDEPTSRQYLQYLLDFDEENALDTIQRAQSKHGDAKTLYQRVLYPVQYEMGRLWQNGGATVAQEHYGTALTQKIITSLIQQEQSESRISSTFLGLCLQDEHHSMGIRMVSDYFALSGWQTIVLESNTPADGVIELLNQKEIAVLGISVTMTYNFHIAEECIQRIRQYSQLQPPLILVGGLAFNTFPELWRAVGADGYTKSAEEAVRFAENHVFGVKYGNE